MQVFSLQIHPCANRLGPLPDQTLLIVPGSFQQEDVQGLPTGNLRDRHHVVPAKVSAFSFHPALLVAFSRRAELRLETPMRSEGDESRRLLPLVASQNLLHRTLQVVITKSLENPREISERQFVRFQKRLLAGVREGAMESASTGHAAHAKYIGLLSLSADIRVRFIPVHLRFSTPNVGLRNERLAVDQRQLDLSFANIASDRRLGHFHLRHLRSDPAPDPMRGVPLLPWCLLVRFQNRTEHRLTYHPPMNPQLLGDPSNRSSTMLILASNLLE